MKTKNDISEKLVSEIVQHIADDTIIYINSKKHKLIGDESDLEYFWNEIYTGYNVYDEYKDAHCSIWDINIGLRYDDTVRSFVFSFWGLLEDTARAFISLQIAGLKSHEKLAIWFKTKQGIDWRYRDESEEADPIPFSDKDIQDYIINLHLCSGRGAWLNKNLLDLFDKKLTSFLSRKSDENFAKEQKTA